MSSGKLPARRRDALYAVIVMYIAAAVLFLMGLYMGWYP